MRLMNKQTGFPQETMTNWKRFCFFSMDICFHFSMEISRFFSGPSKG